MKEELWEILRDLEMGKISVNYANDRILRLFGVMVELPDYELNFCPKCFQMTNHLNGICQKCKGN